MNHVRTGYALATIWLLVVVAVDAPSQAAPRRPSNSASACSISADKFNQLAAKNPSGAQTCKNMADNAQAHGGSFSFMCDAATGEISCCNDSSCVSLGSALKRGPPGLRPDLTPQGNIPVQPNQGGKPGMAFPPNKMTLPPPSR